MMIPCGKSELLLFDEVPVQATITGSSWVDFHSITNTETGGPIEFFIGGTQDEYLDLNDTKLYIKAKLQVAAEDGVVAPVNLLLNSLFQDVTITLNDTVVQGGDQLYAYKAMMNTMLLFDNGTKSTQMSAAGWIPDDVGAINNHTVDGNSGFKKRNAMTLGAKSFELIGPLHLDLMMQPRYLLPSVDIRIRLTRQPNSFTLLCANKKGKVGNIVIEKAILYVRKAKVLPSVIEGHEEGMLKYNAIYPIQHTRVQTFTVPQGTQSFNKENLFQGRMPKLIVIGLVSNKALNGDVAENPYNFQQFDISYCGLFRDGESIPEREPYKIEGEGQLVRPYMGMIHALEMFNKNENNGITLEEYQNGSLLFVFNLTPDLTAGSGCQQAYRSGNIRLEMQFRKALPSTINVLVYGVFDGKVEVTKNRNIFIDY